jgi:uncharacterized membrane protein
LHSVLSLGEKKLTDMIVLAFSGEDGADQGRKKLVELNDEYMLDLADAVEVVRTTDGKIKIKNINNLTGAGAMNGAFWGFLFGLLFFMPLFGVVVGAVSGAIAGHFTNYGISRDFLKQIEESVKPGTSALAIIASNVTVDKAVQALTSLHPKVIRSSLSTEQEAKLNEAFGSHTE